MYRIISYHIELRDEFAAVVRTAVGSVKLFSATDAFLHMSRFAEATQARGMYLNYADTFVKTLKSYQRPGRRKGLYQQLTRS